MTDFKIIPAIDIMNGECVRLFQGDFNQKKIYNTDPLLTAKSFEKNGLKYLHLVDLDGARNGMPINWEVISDICKNTNLEVEFGGGIRTIEDIQRLLDLGVKTINISSIVVTDPVLFINLVKEFGSDRFSVGLDVKDGFVYIHGRKTKTDFSLDGLLQKWRNYGIRKFNITSIDNDGSMQGIDEMFYEEIVRRYPELEIIASGGVKDMQDVMKIKNIGCFGVIVGKAIYEGKIDLVFNYE